MAGKKPDWNVKVSRESGEGDDKKTYYSDVGAAWNVGNGGISIQLTSLPTDGRLVLFPRRDEGAAG